MIQMANFYQILALFLIYAGCRNFRDGKIANAGFWLLVGVICLSGDYALARSKLGDKLPVQFIGAGVVILGLLATRMRKGDTPELPVEQRRELAAKLGHKLFLPALLIPLVTVLVVIFGDALTKGSFNLLGEGSLTLMGLSLAGLVALAAAALVTGQGRYSLREGSRLLDSMGWAALLPLILAVLGGVFAKSGIGQTIADGISMMIPTDSKLACVLAYALGMVIFTVIMGNAFAAFPVMTAGIGLPLLIGKHGADPAIMGAIGMLTGYCGTLLTPMAANFNLVPAALLELRDPNGVIRAQVATAIPLMIVNIFLMYVLIFR